MTDLCPCQPCNCGPVCACGASCNFAPTDQQTLAAAPACDSACDCGCADQEAQQA